MRDRKPDHLTGNGPTLQRPLFVGTEEHRFLIALFPLPLYPFTHAENQRDPGNAALGRGSGAFAWLFTRRSSDVSRLTGVRTASSPSALKIARFSCWLKRVLLPNPRKLPGGTIPPNDGDGESHLAFSISPDQLATWEEWLGKQGIEIESKVSWMRGGTSLYFRDPDGNLLELVTPGIWTIY